MSITQALKQGVQRLFSGTGYGATRLPLNKTAKENVESELTPQDFDLKPLVEDYEESKLVRLVLKNYNRAAIARRTHEPEWLTNTAFEAGNQWVEWRSLTNRLENIRDKSDPYRSYHTDNNIRPLGEKVVQRATSSKPDVIFEPWTNDPKDQGATAEARDINDFYNQKYDMQSAWIDWASSAWITSTTFRKVIWNPKEDALVWSQTVDKFTGQASIKVQDAPGAGDINELLVPPYEVFPDPNARGDWDTCAWIIHCKLYPLSWFQDCFGERGARVQASVGGTINTWADAVLDAISGDLYRGDPTTSAQAYYYEYWEMPTARYPKGRMIPVGGNQLLVELNDVDWPYEKKDSYPLIPLGYGGQRQSVWNYSGVHDLIPLQRQLNQLWSRMLDRVNTLKVTILANRQAKIAIGAYQSRRNFEIIKYDMGAQPPDYQVPPFDAEQYLAPIQALIARMENLAGARPLADPANGIPTVTAASGIQILRDEDVERLSGFTTRIEKAAKQLAEWRISLASQFYAEPRYLAVSQHPDVQSNDSQARDFKNIQAGGKVRVIVKDGSAVPKSAAAQDQWLMDIARAGMFQPQNLPITSLVLQMSSFNVSDKFKAQLQDLIAKQEQILAQQAAQPLQLQQQNQEQEAAKQLQDHKNQLDLKQADTQGKIAIEQAKGQVQGQLIGVENGWELQAAEMEATRAKPAITLALKGTATPALVVSAADQMGLNAGSIADAEKVNAPPLAPTMGQNGVGSKPASQPAKTSSTDAKKD